MSTAVGKGAGLPPVVGQKKVGLEQLGEDISPSTISIDSDDQLTNFDDDPFFSSLFSDLDTHSEDNETTSDASTSEGEDIVLRNLNQNGYENAILISTSQSTQHFLIA